MNEFEVNLSIEDIERMARLREIKTSYNIPMGLMAKLGRIATLEEIRNEDGQNFEQRLLDEELIPLPGYKYKQGDIYFVCEKDKTAINGIWEEHCLAIPMEILLSLQQQPGERMQDTLMKFWASPRVILELDGTLALASFVLLKDAEEGFLTGHLLEYVDKLGGKDQKPKQKGRPPLSPENKQKILDTQKTHPTLSAQKIGNMTGIPESTVKAHWKKPAIK